ncbi:FAD-binding oxidoreductase [Alteromonas sediminis]|uniref:FAD-binding oxidoreductase n=1 Tax=Alteromonas sediminis TaxID=2259342 RepID=A0A3N5Y0D2_9ALTE|nr:FAD-dependent oxidoreductase [Alteromonas sediminis]RPJ65926.1 FAD-binding oxidoreductase [Alteromonas sediminis]
MYDPLVDSSAPSTFSSPESHWAKGYAPPNYPENNRRIEVDVAVVGGGYTGLSTAYHIEQSSELSCCVLEANQPGWGCSGRNGGFVLPGTGRLSTAQMAKNWGKPVSQAVYAEYLASIETVSDFIDSGIECDKIEGGYLKLAHKPELTATLHQQATMLSQDYGDSIVPLTQQQVQQDYLAGVKHHGGIYYPQAFAINPWLFARGLAEKTAQAGVTIFGNSPVRESHFDGSFHHLHTEKGFVKAKHLVIATNAYTPKTLFTVLQDRTFPVISSILVTEPLDAAQLSALGIKPGLMVMDTRSLKYYYRLLPDNRLLFGGRGAIYGKDADTGESRKALMKGLFRTFPTLKDVDITQFWSGWVAVSLDDYPRLYHDTSTHTLYSAGYCGAGLAFSVHAGKRLSQLLLEPNMLPQLPYWQSPLKKFPMASLRRPALKAFYAMEAFKQIWER